jgi:hypothetical protein
MFLGKTSEGSVFFYDPERISVTIDGKIGIWLKEIPDDSENIYRATALAMRYMCGSAEKIDRYEKKYADYYYSVRHCEVDCDRQKIVPTSSYDYDKRGNLLYASTDDAELLGEMRQFHEFGITTTIEPGTIWEILANEVCQYKAQLVMRIVIEGKREAYYDNRTVHNEG